MRPTATGAGLASVVVVVRRSVVVVRRSVVGGSVSSGSVGSGSGAATVVVPKISSGS